MPFSNIGQVRQGAKFFNQPSIEEKTKESKDRLSKTLSNHYDGLHNRRYGQQPDRGRTAFSTVIDLLSTGTYASAGFARGLVNDDLNPFVGMAQGIKAGVSGKEEYRHTYSRVLGDMGWEPESTGGKIARGAVGLVGDIFLDPMTYLTGGASALVKGSGKSTARVTHNMTRAMSAQDAIPIARGFFKGRGIAVTPAQVSDAGAELARVMNASAGFAKKSTPLRLSFEGAPFGKKIFGKHASKGIELVSAETMARIGDSTFAPIYKGVRDTFFGSKMGDLFSTKKLAYQASKQSPEALLEVIAPKMRKDMLKMASRETFAEFKARANDLKFDDATAKEIFDVLEDKSVWKKVQEMVGIRDIDEAGKYIDNVENKYRSAKESVNNLDVRVRQNMDTAKNIEARVSLEKEKVTDLNRQLNTLLEDGNVNQSDVNNVRAQLGESRKKLRQAESRLANKNEHLQNYYNQIEDLKNVKGNAHHLTTDELKKVNKLKRDLFNLDENLRSVKGEQRKLRSTLNKKHKSILDKSKKFGEFETAKGKAIKQKSNFNNTVDVYTPEGVTLSSKRKSNIMRKLNPSQKHANGEHYITYARKDSARQLSELTGWEYDQLATGEFYVNIPTDVALDGMVNMPASSVAKVELIGDLGDYAYGNRNVLREDLSSADVNKIVDFMKKNKSPEEVQAFIEQNRRWFQKDTREMYSFVANEFGYKDFKRDIVEPMQELQSGVKAQGATLSELEIRRLHELEDIYMNRNNMVSSLSELSVEERNKFMQGFKEGQLMDALDEAKELRRGLEGAGGEFQFDHRKLRFGEGDTRSTTSLATEAHQPTQAEEYFVRLKANNGGKLDAGDAKALFAEKKARFDRMKKSLPSGAQYEVRKVESRMFKSFQAPDNVKKRFDSRIEGLLKSKPEDYKKQIVQLKKRRHDELKRAYQHIDDSINAYDNELSRRLSAHRYNPSLRVNPLEDEFIRKVELTIDSNKGAITTDLYDSMRKQAPFIGSPNQLSEYDVGFLEMAHDKLKHNVLRGDYGRAIDVENLTPDQYKRLLDKSIKDVLSDLADGKSKLSKGSSEIPGMIRGRKTIQEVTREATERKAKLAKKAPENISDQLKKVSKTREDIEANMAKLQNNIDELRDISYLNDIELRKREIKQLETYIDNVSGASAEDAMEIAHLESETRRLSQEATSLQERADKLSDINSRLQNTKRHISELEKTGELLQGKIQNDAIDIGDTVRKYMELEEVIANDDLLTRYIMNVDNRIMSEAERANLLEKYSTIEYVLDENVNVSDRAREYANMLREEFRRMGMDEVKIGKLTEGQFEAMIEGYLPRVVTDEGKKFFKANSEGVETIKGFGDTFGFGKQFNPHGKSRVIDALFDANGNIIKENPTLREINEHFARTFPELKGKNVFSDNLQDLFLARAQKNVDLMYDHQYMNEITEIFGEAYEPWMKGAKNIKGKMTTANIGRFREDVSNYAKVERQMVIDEAVENFIANHKYKRFNQATGQTEHFGVVEDVKRVLNLKNTRNMENKGRFFTEAEYSEEFSRLISRKVEAFTKRKFPESLRREMVENSMEQFMNNTNTVGYLDDLSMPFLEFDSRQADTIYESITSIKEQRLNQIKAGSKSPIAEGETLHGAGIDITSSKGMYRTVDTATGEVIQTPKKGGLTKFLSDVRGGELPPEDLRRIGDADVTELRKILDENLPYMNRMEYDRYKRYVNKLNTLDNLKTDSIRLVPEGMTERFNTGRKLQIQRDNSDMLNLWDKMTKFVKLNQTTVTPGFHGKNKLGNTFRNWLELGTDAIDPRMQRDTLNVVRKKGKVAGGFDIIRADGSTGYMSWEDAWNMADDLGVTSGGWFAFDGTPGSNLASKLGVKSKYNPFDLENFAVYNKGAEIGKVVEDQDRFLHFVSKLKKGVNPLESASSSQKFLFDYGDLTFFEQSVMKRIMPYYTWMRKNTPLQLEMMLESPKKYMGVAKVYRGIEGMSDEEDLMDSGFVNEFAQDWIQTPFTVKNQHGREEKVLWNPNLPFMDLNNLPNLFKPKQSAKNMFSNLSPLITQPVEQAFNRNVFFDSDIVREDDNALAKRIDHSLRQLVPYNVGKGMIQKRGADRALHAWNNTTGIRFLSYDYNMYRAMKLEELSNMTNQEYFDMMNERTWEFRKNQPVNGVTHSFAGKMSRAMHGITKFVDDSKPTPAGMYNGALRPISQSTFNSLSEEEQAKYIPPDNETAWAYHKQAVELEREAYEEARAPVRFVWGLFDNIGVRSENKDGYIIGKVTNVVDGDTFDIDVGGEVKRIRPLLVDTPELDHESGIHEPYAEEATQFADDFLFDKDVRIIFDGNNTDVYGRTLGYVELPGDGVDYNRELLQRGYAITNYIFEPRYDRLREYTRAEREAKRDQLRLHGK